MTGRALLGRHEGVRCAGNPAVALCKTWVFSLAGMWERGAVRDRAAPARRNSSQSPLKPLQSSLQPQNAPRLQIPLTWPLPLLLHPCHTWRGKICHLCPCRCPQPRRGPGVSDSPGSTSADGSGTDRAGGTPRICPWHGAVPPAEHISRAKLCPCPPGPPTE